MLPAWPFYGGPPINPDTTARATIREFLDEVNNEETERALVLPNYGVPVATAAFELNALAIETAQKDDRVSGGPWVSPKQADAGLNAEALLLASEDGVRALKNRHGFRHRVPDRGRASAGAPSTREVRRRVDLQHPDPAATPPAVSLDGPQLRRVAELAGDMVVCSDSRRSWPGIPASSGTTQRSRSAGTVCSGPTARCTSRSESRWSTSGVTVWRPSKPRSVGWGCSSTTTRPSRRRLGRSPSTASVTDRAERSQQDRQSRLFDLYDCACAAENQVIVVSSNQTGVTGGLRFLGQAKVVGPGGDVLARTGSRGALAAAAIDVRYEITRARRMLHHLDERVLDSSHSALTRPGR